MPPVGSTDQGSDHTVTLADLIREDAPLIALAIRVQGSGENALPLQIHHNGVDGALVALRIQSHAPHKV